MFVNTLGTRTPGYIQVYNNKKVIYLERLYSSVKRLNNLLFNVDGSINSNINPGQERTGFTGICRELFREMIEYSQFYSTYPSLEDILKNYLSSKEAFQSFIRNPTNVEIFKNYIMK